MMEGWIKIYRKISDNPLWNCEPFTRGQAWVDLILLASFNDTFFYVRGIKIEQKRGQVCWSEPKLADRWKWSRTKLRKFLNDLEKEQQIIQHKNNVTQVITIINYDEYQEKEQQTGQQKDSRKTAERQQKDVIEECKEIQECKEEYIDNKLSFLDSEKFDFKKSLIDLGIEISVVNDWLKVRKKKGAANTKTAFNGLKTQIEKSGLNANECIKIATERSWQGFKAEWLIDNKNKYETSEKNRRIIAPTGSHSSDRL